MLVPILALLEQGEAALLTISLIYIVSIPFNIKIKIQDMLPPHPSFHSLLCLTLKILVCIWETPEINVFKKLTVGTKLQLLLGNCMCTSSVSHWYSHFMSCRRLSKCGLVSDKWLKLSCVLRIVWRANDR